MRIPAFTAPWQIDVTGTLLCAATAAAAWFLVIAPRVDSIRQVTARREAAEQRVLDATRQVEIARRLAEKLEKVEEEIARAPSSLRQVSEVNRQLAFINDMTIACGLETDALALAERIPGREYETIPLEYAGRGNFTSIIALLAQLKERSPDMAVISFGMEGETTIGRDVLHLKMVLAWYAAPNASARLAVAG